ncbi:MAG: electron transfer flavoprotein subunit beta/FixA family protein [Planctomycetia bacterium]
MHVLVCVKRVVDTETRVKVAADGKSLDATGVQHIVAPYDEIAVEKALQLRDAAGQGSVTVLTIGPADASKELRTALAMGADAALHVVAEPPTDPWATAGTLAAAVRGRSFDLLLLGKQATDEDDAAVGPLLAALLGLPCVTWVNSIERSGTGLVVRREADGETEVLEVPLPCVLTAQKGLAEPRLPGLKGIMNAKKKAIEAVAVPVAAGKSEVLSLSLPPARGALTKVDPTPEGMRTLLTALRNDRKVL